MTPCPNCGAAGRWTDDATNRLVNPYFEMGCRKCGLSISALSATAEAAWAMPAARKDEREKVLAAIRAIPELLDDKGRSIYVAYDVYRVIMEREIGK